MWPYLGKKKALVTALEGESGTIERVRIRSTMKEKVLMKRRRRRKG